MCFHQAEDCLDELERQGKTRVRMELPYLDGPPQVRTIEQARWILRAHPNARPVEDA